MKRNILGSLAIVVLSAAFVVHHLTPEKEKFVKVVEQAMPAVVEIRVEGIMTLTNPFTEEQVDKKVGVLGSGVFISSKGHIITAAHLFRDFKSISTVEITSPNGDVVAGSVVKIASKADLAVVKVFYYKTTPKVKLADPRGLKVGQECFAIGSPLGLSFSVTSGIISALYRDFDYAYNVTQSDTVINPGNSGGPMFNLQGELIGINVFMVMSDKFSSSFSGLGFSEQCGEILKFLVDVKKTDPEVLQ